LYIPWIGVQNTMGMGVKIPLVGVRYSRDRGFDILWVWSPSAICDRGSIYHG
jgi:hypothetical protein